MGGLILWATPAPSSSLLCNNHWQNLILNVAHYFNLLIIHESVSDDKTQHHMWIVRTVLDMTHHDTTLQKFDIFTNTILTTLALLFEFSTSHSKNWNFIIISCTRQGLVLLVMSNSPENSPPVNLSSKHSIYSTLFGYSYLMHTKTLQLFFLGSC